jgi:hypothetical protein
MQTRYRADQAWEAHPAADRLPVNPQKDSSGGHSAARRMVRQTPLPISLPDHFPFGGQMFDMGLFPA